MSNNFCSKCGAPLNNNAAFCPNCGSRVGVGFADAPTGTMQPEFDFNWNDETDTQKKYFSFKGRLHRKPYLCRTFVVQFLVAFIALFLIPDEQTATVISNTISAVLCITMNVRRLHDLNRSGWLMLIAIIPIIGFFFNLYLLFAKGTTGQNDYGPDPLQFGGYSTL